MHTCSDDQKMRLRLAHVYNSYTIDKYNEEWSETVEIQVVLLQRHQ